MNPLLVDRSSAVDRFLPVLLVNAVIGKRKWKYTVLLMFLEERIKQR